MQQSDINVLSTKQIDEALITKAAGNRFVVEAIAFIETKPLNDEALQQTIQVLGSKNVTAVFTSINAVNSVTTKLIKVPCWKIFCIGGITKEHVIKYFGEAAIVASAKNATALAEKIIAASDVTMVSFFCGDQRLNELPQTLAKYNIVVQEVVVYTSVQTPVFISKNYDAILFFSPSAVHSFFSVNTIHTDVVLFSIGGTTTASIQSYCANEVLTSEWPGTESLFELLNDFYKEKK